MFLTCFEGETASNENYRLHLEKEKQNEHSYFKYQNYWNVKILFQILKKAHCSVSTRHFLLTGQLFYPITALRLTDSQMRMAAILEAN